MLYVAVPISVKALEVGKWTFEKADEYCYIGSLAIDSDLPPEKIRGNFYVLVYKNIGIILAGLVVVLPKYFTINQIFSMED